MLKTDEIIFIFPNISDIHGEWALKNIMLYKILNDSTTYGTRAFLDKSLAPTNINFLLNKILLNNPRNIHKIFDCHLLETIYPNNPKMFNNFKRWINKFTT